jgi:agmatinase
MEEIGDRGLDAVVADVVAVAKSWDHVFLSFDIDVCDPAFAPGTGTPEPGGITAREALRAVRRLALEVRFAGMEVVEVSPPYDHADMTALLANRLVLEALSGLALRKLGQEPTPQRSR